MAVVYKNNENFSSKKKRVLTLMFVVIMTKEIWKFHVSVGQIMS